MGVRPRQRPVKAGPVDPVEALLDFLLALRQFTLHYGVRRPPPQFDDVVTGQRGMEPLLDTLRNRRARRR